MLATIIRIVGGGIAFVLIIVVPVTLKYRTRLYDDIDRHIGS